MLTNICTYLVNSPSMIHTKCIYVYTYIQLKIVGWLVSWLAGFNADNIFQLYTACLVFPGVATGTKPIFANN